MKYEIRMNGTYMNRYKTYTEAVKAREHLKQRYKGAKIEIISL